MQKKLRKSLTDKVLAGVCSGIADFFDITPPIVRTIFLFTAPISLGVYLILALSLENP